MIEQKLPRYKQYAYAILMGATTYCMNGRLEYLQQLIDNGIHIDHIVLLTSQRPLDPAIDDVSLGQTEGDACIALAKQLPLWISHAPQAIIAPMYPTAQGSVRRANTDDTIREWLATHPTPGNCLVISNQPFVARQTAVCERLITGNNWSFEGVGSAEKSYKNRLSAILDEFARLVYERYQASLTAAA
jgi:hypothetical protein